jgi:hypothetical protein
LLSFPIMTGVRAMALGNGVKLIIQSTLLLAAVAGFAESIGVGSGHRLAVRSEALSRHHGATASASPPAH